MLHKTCSNCGKVKDISNFTVSNVIKGKSYYKKECNECRKLSRKDCQQKFKRGSCRWCGQELDNPKGAACLECSKKKKDESNQKTYRTPNRRDTHYRHKYGITLTEVMESTNCDICGYEFKSKDKERMDRFVDHNHDTGEVRGILCINCNRGLGFFGDNPGTLEKALNYLKSKGHYGNE